MKKNKLDIRGIQQWSIDADENATIDPEINWQEGQMPSTVNNSARMMMARLKEQYIIDNSDISKNNTNILDIQFNTPTSAPIDYFLGLGIDEKILKNFYDDDSRNIYYSNEIIVNTLNDINNLTAVRLLVPSVGNAGYTAINTMFIMFVKIYAKLEDRHYTIPLKSINYFYPLNKDFDKIFFGVPTSLNGFITPVEVNSFALTIMDKRYASQGINGFSDNSDLGGDALINFYWRWVDYVTAEITLTATSLYYRQNSAIMFPLPLPYSLVEIVSLSQYPSYNLEFMFCNRECTKITSSLDYFMIGVKRKSPETNTSSVNTFSIKILVKKLYNAAYYFWCPPNVCKSNTRQYPLSSMAGKFSEFKPFVETYNIFNDFKKDDNDG